MSVGIQLQPHYANLQMLPTIRRSDGTPRTSPDATPCLGVTNVQLVHGGANIATNGLYLSKSSRTIRWCAGLVRSKPVQKSTFSPLCFLRRTRTPPYATNAAKDLTNVQFTNQARLGDVANELFNGHVRRPGWPIATPTIAAKDKAKIVVNNSIEIVL